MQTAVTMSSRNQIVVPRKTRGKLNLHPDRQFPVLCKEDRIVRVPEPEDLVGWMSGLCRETWAGADDYLKGEIEAPVLFC